MKLIKIEAEAKTTDNSKGEAGKLILDLETGEVKKVISYIYGGHPDEGLFSSGYADEVIIDVTFSGLTYTLSKGEDNDLLMDKATLSRFVAALGYGERYSYRLIDPVTPNDLIGTDPNIFLTSVESEISLNGAGSDVDITDIEYSFECGENGSVYIVALLKGFFISLVDE